LTVCLFVPQKYSLLTTGFAPFHNLSLLQNSEHFLKAINWV